MTEGKMIPEFDIDDGALDEGRNAIVIGAAECEALRQGPELPQSELFTVMADLIYRIQEQRKRLSQIHAQILCANNMKDLKGSVRDYEQFRREATVLIEHGSGVEAAALIDRVVYFREDIRHGDADPAEVAKVAFPLVERLYLAEYDNPIQKIAEGPDNAAQSFSKDLFERDIAAYSAEDVAAAIVRAEMNKKYRYEIQLKDDDRELVEYIEQHQGLRLVTQRAADRVVLLDPDGIDPFNSEESRLQLMHNEVRGLVRYLSGLSEYEVALKPIDGAFTRHAVRYEGYGIGEISYPTLSSISIANEITFQRGGLNDFYELDLDGVGLDRLDYQHPNAVPMALQRIMLLSSDLMNLYVDAHLLYDIDAQGESSAKDKLRLSLVRLQALSLSLAIERREKDINIADIKVELLARGRTNQVIGEYVEADEEEVGELNSHKAVIARVGERASRWYRSKKKSREAIFG